MFQKVIKKIPKLEQVDIYNNRVTTLFVCSNYKIIASILYNTCPEFIEWSLYILCGNVK